MISRPTRQKILTGLLVLLPFGLTVIILYQLGKLMIEKKRVPKYFRYAAYVALFFFFFVAFIYLYFPADSLTKRINQEIKTRTGLNIEASSAGIFPLADVKLKKVQLIDRRKKTTLFDELRISPSLLSVFKESGRISFEAKIKDGRIKGVVEYSGGGKKLDFLEVKTDKVDLKVLKELLKNAQDVPNVNGKVNGEFVVLFDQKSSASGRFKLSSEKFSLSGLKFKEFPLPDFKDLKLDVKGRMKKNRTNVETFRAENNELLLVLNGTAPLPWKIKRENLDLSVNLKLKPGSQLGFLKTFAKKEKDGIISVKVKGPLKNLRFE